MELKRRLGEFDGSVCVKRGSTMNAVQDVILIVAGQSAPQTMIVKRKGYCSKHFRFKTKLIHPDMMAQQRVSCDSRTIY